MNRSQKTKRIQQNKRRKRLRLLVTLSIILLLFLAFFSFYKLFFAKKLGKISKVVAVNSEHTAKINKEKTDDEIPQAILNSKNEISDSQDKDIRKFPFPYVSMLAICSDIDDATLEEFKDYHKFLNTKEQTPYGEGIGLDIGDSIWMYMADNVPYIVDKHGNGVENIMTYYKGIDKNQKHNAEEIKHFVESGWIDSIHTFGDFSTKGEKTTSFNRALASDSWKELNSINFKPTVWINHGNRSNKQNFGAQDTSSFMSYQQGDNPKSNYYHTDMTLSNGVRYVWNSLGDSHFGYDYPLFEISLRDGKKVWGFKRYTNNIVNNKIDWTWTPKHINRQLTQENLENLIKNKQYSIVGQHFGINTEDLFTKENVDALKRLKSYEDNGKILIAKTSRLLNYANVHKHIMYNKLDENGKTYINITSINDPIFGRYVPTLNDLRGITFYCSNPEKTELLLNKVIINKNELQINPKDETGQATISIKWFTPDYKDYTK